MAKKKGRTPPPPRPVQAPRQRLAEGLRGRDPRRMRLLVMVLAGGLAVAGIAGGLAAALGGGGGGGGGGGSPAAALAAAGCTFETFPSQVPIEGRVHFEELPEGFEYNSFPPSQGPHSSTAAVWNVYDQPVEQINLVHNLEHGGIVVQYGDKVAQTTIEEIIEWYSGDPSAMVVASLPALGDQIALAAWTGSEEPVSNTEELYTKSRGNLAKCTSFDQDAFDAFRDAFRGRGPEEVPLELMQPGT